MYYLPVLDSLQECYEPTLTLELIEGIEKTLEVTFPLDFVEFLLQFNGGEFQHPVGFRHPEPNFTDFVRLNFFYGGIADPSDYRRFGWFDHPDKPIPDGCLPIACNEYDYILMHLRGEPYLHGTIWLWDSSDYWAPTERKYLHRIADNFHKFLELLEPLTEDRPEKVETDPIFRQVEDGDLSGVQKYLASGGEVDYRNAQGQTLLAAAAKYIWPKIVKLLLEQGATINSRDHEGRTPLHHAAVRSMDSAKLLVAAGADMKARDHNGKVVSLGPDHWYQMHEFLLRHGGDV